MARRHPELGIPTLSHIRRHIVRNAWNGRSFTSKMSHYDVFVGQCECTSTALSEMLTGTGLKSEYNNDWSLRVRGWYTGNLTEIKTRYGCDEHAFSEGKHCHSWVEYKGLLIDPTYWQFAGDPVGVYVFQLDDPRYKKDPKA